MSPNNRRKAAASLAAVLAVSGFIAVPSVSQAADDPPGTLAFDFGSGEVAEGYTEVACDTVLADGASFGFGAPAGERTRVSSQDPLRKDFCLGNMMDFSVALANGDYRVRVISGDADASQSRMSISAQGTEMFSGGVTAGQFIDETFIATVTDGVLSLHFDAGAQSARINALEISPVVDEPWDSALALIDDGSGAVQLQNSAVSLRIDKKSAAITQLRSNGADPNLNLLAGGGGDHLANYAIDGVRKQNKIRNAEMRVVSQSDERIELAFAETQHDPEKNGLPFEVEVHIALEADSPGFYLYSIYRYPEEMPENVQLEQLRYGFNANTDLFTWYSVDGDRMGLAPLQSELDAGVTLQDATYRLADGTVYSKYQQISHPEGTDSVAGIYGEHVGLSLIQPNKDWMSGGPTRQELTTHTGGGSRLLWHETSAHYTSELITPEYGWEKVYGPFFLYVQEGSSPHQMYAAAEQKLEEEKAKWPYQWVSEPAYAADSRGSASGRLTIADGTSNANAWVLLTDPGADDWQLDFEDYIYAARTDADGNFTIPAVRAGEYTLRAFADGAFGELALAGVTIEPNQENTLGIVEFTPETHGEELWRIGEPDRSAAEFHVADAPESRVPGLQPYQRWGTWLQYPIEFPDGVDFEVGEDDPAEDWNYFQPAIQTPGTPETLLVDEDRTPTSWKIRFDADGQSDGSATLTFGIASSVFGSLRVAINGEEVANWPELPGNSNDSALYRQSDRGVYRELTATFDASLLKDSGNVIELMPVEDSIPGEGAWTNVFASVMYDAIRLEVDPSETRAPGGDTDSGSDDDASPAPNGDTDPTPGEDNRPAPGEDNVPAPDGDRDPSTEAETDSEPGSGDPDQSESTSPEDDQSDAGEEPTPDDGMDPDPGEETIPDEGYSAEPDGEAGAEEGDEPSDNSDPQGTPSPAPEPDGDVMPGEDATPVPDDESTPKPERPVVPDPSDDLGDTSPPTDQTTDAPSADAGESELKPTGTYMTIPLTAFGVTILLMGVVALIVVQRRRAQ